MRTGWADGPEFVTQCPIRPGGSYTYRFTIQGQEGTLWWHAHSSWLRATARRTGGAPNISDAYTINGQPGDLYNCSSQDTVIVPINSGETNFLRVINAALNQPLFFTVAKHKLTVVGADASYVKPFTTSVLMLGPGQTTDVLISGDQSPARYYMAARAYQSAQNAPFDNTTTTAILEYKSAPCGGKNCSTGKPIMPPLPAYNDTATVTSFTGSFKSRDKVFVPTDIDESLYFTVGLGLNPCPKNFNKSAQCQGPNGTRFTASMNNVSFVLPSNFSLLQAHHQRIQGVFTTDFPANPPRRFDYTGNVSRSLFQPVPGTKLYKLKYGSRDTSIVTPENHPIHLHGYDFYIVGQGFGNFNPRTDPANFNLVDPPLRNTVAVPVNGWAVIRFVADNPEWSWNIGIYRVSPRRSSYLLRPVTELIQCPIRPGGSYTYRFTVDGQEGTLWWHAHSSWLRATVYGALIIHPREGSSYPFAKPHRETPLLLGETNLLRVINAALNQELFFTIANHKFTVVGADASYLKPFTTSVIMLGPGQTTDVLISGDQPPAQYYIAARPYQSAQNVPFANTTTTAILEYKAALCPTKCTTKPIMPLLPAFNDTATVTAFSNSLRFPKQAEVPSDVDENLFFTVGLGVQRCPKNFRARRCQGPINGTRFTASMNNVSFVLPSNYSLLQAHHHNIPGVFTTDFPANPPVKFDYTGNVSQALWQPVRGTKLYKLKYGSRVQVVLQDTSIISPENHPIHLHGYDFFIVAEGFGNFNPKKDVSKFNLVDPPMRNTVAVPVNGWAAFGLCTVTWMFILDGVWPWLSW
ncbi:hypothetical protein Tsubulata_019913 [Turnera subulata]|uniref:laccase n=1 Tax=Turnera subulata TaxID=218843 RepID=A0A9Q0GI91_9ROSI|nr:hypothetical protein Tsubulata_019913 [Turnera subulata]